MTYNILAKAYADEKYFPKCPHECLAWDFRFVLIPFSIFLEIILIIFHTYKLLRLFSREVCRLASNSPLAYTIMT